ncbi:Poly(A) polymerase precursor [Oligella urethralis]|uniref:polynucleotide adenylyltransferase PcnB n=1 Tax=Oligella urethralis TaxID=90245 RepID=UPI000DFD05A7|nr:polynucleotide adenylyltransferase PcnB [Oligella urethralis]SUA54449.1 Poly(A) polymerase precursor [Oligella urethralis]
MGTEHKLSINSFLKKLFNSPAEDKNSKRRHPKKAAGSGSKPEAVIYGADEHQIQNHLISRNAIKVCQVLQDAGYEAFIVGGAVRDLTLGLQPKDFDVATNATPEQVKPLFRRSLIIGRRFRLVHCIFGREIIEVSTYRAASKQKQLTDEFGRVLSDNVYGNQAQDAERRDFTINSLYYDPIREELIDYHNGLHDIRHRIVRIIGDAEARYREDPVRLLRALRFQAKLNGTLESSTSAPIQAMAELLVNVPESRLADESLKLLCCGNSMLCLKQIEEHGISDGILPLINLLQEQLSHNKFLQIALERTDYRIRSNKTVSPSFLYASALWPLVNDRWQYYRNERKEPPVPALVQAAHEVLENFARHLSLQRRQSSDMREIWFMQPRFEKRSLRAIHRMFDQPRFRAAVDFLQIRAAAGEFDSVLAQWWMDLADADSENRQAMLAELPQQALQQRTAGTDDEAVRVKRRRRPRRRNNANRKRKNTAAKADQTSTGGSKGDSGND